MAVKTFTVDAEGVGRPDYSAPAPIGQIPKPTVYTLSDMAELAARLGSIVTFDRRGDVIWLDDFEDNINKWVQSAVGTGGSIGLSNDAARSGSMSAKLVTPSDALLAARLYRDFLYPEVGKIGAEISFTINNNLDFFQLGLQFWTETKYTNSLLRYLPSEKALYYVDSNNVQRVILSNVNLFAVTPLFHTLKLVVDIKTDKYIRVLLDSYYVDMSEIACPTYTGVYTKDFDCQITAMGKAGLNIAIYVDDFILTQNEPVNPY
jgi:hypothetical protein